MSNPATRSPLLLAYDVTPPWTVAIRYTDDQTLVIDVPRQWPRLMREQAAWWHALHWRTRSISLIACALCVAIISIFVLTLSTRTGHTLVVFPLGLLSLLLLFVTVSGYLMWRVSAERQTRFICDAMTLTINETGLLNRTSRVLLFSQVKRVWFAPPIGMQGDRSSGLTLAIGDEEPLSLWWYVAPADSTRIAKALAGHLTKVSIARGKS